MKIVLFFSLLFLFSLAAFSEENVNELTETPVVADDSPSQSEEVEDDDDLNLFVKAVDWLESLPFSFDLGCEPTDDYGATIFGSVEYRWKPDVSTQLFYEFSKEQKIDKTTRELTKEIEDSTQSRVFLKFFPYKKTIRVETLPRHHFSFGLGVRYESSYTETNSSLNYQNSEIAGSSLFMNRTVATTQRLYDVGPCVEFDYSFPIFNWLVVNSENSFSFCYLHTKSNISTEYTNVQVMPDESTSQDKFESIFIDVKVHLDFFKFFGIVAQYNLEKIPMNYLFYDNSENFKTEEYDYVMQKFRFGLALIAVRKNYVRIQTGFYRQLEWVTNHSRDTEHTEKWVFSVTAGF